MVQDLEHIFCSCLLVREAWQWVRKKMVEILAGVRQAPVSNSELILAVFPKTRQENEAVFFLSNYLLLVDSEVVTKKRELLTETLKGFIEAKLQAVVTRAVPQIHITL